LKPPWHVSGTRMQKSKIILAVIPFHKMSCSGRIGHSNVFVCFASFEKKKTKKKTYQPARENNKHEKITKFMQIY
jgi:hypothetical protein